MFKKSLISATLVCASGAACAAEDGLEKFGLSLSGSVGLTSDYRWRGQAQGQNDPAIQGAFTLAHDSGLYFSTFASNVDFGATDDTDLELSPQIGFAKAVKIGPLEPTVDVGAVYYNYPGNSDINWWEFYGKLVFADVVVGGDSLAPSIAYTSEYAASDAAAWNFNLAYSIPFADTGFGGVASVGYSISDDEDEFAFGAGNDVEDSYIDWKIGLTYAFKTIDGLSAELAAVGSNIDGYTKDSDQRLYDTGAVFTITKAF